MLPSAVVSIEKTLTQKEALSPATKDFVDLISLMFRSSTADGDKPDKPSV